MTERTVGRSGVMSPIWERPPGICMCARRLSVVSVTCDVVTIHLKMISLKAMRYLMEGGHSGLVATVRYNNCVIANLIENRPTACVLMSVESVESSKIERGDVVHIL